MASGTVKRFNDTKGYWFITPDEGAKDLFVHHTNIVGEGFRSLTEGGRVEFEAHETTKGRRRRTLPRPSRRRREAGRVGGHASTRRE